MLLIPFHWIVSDASEFLACVSSLSDLAHTRHYTLVQCIFSLSYWFPLSSRLHLLLSAVSHSPTYQLLSSLPFYLLLSSRSISNCIPKRAPVHDTWAPRAASAAVAALSALCAHCSRSRSASCWVRFSPSRTALPCRRRRRRARKTSAWLCRLSRTPFVLLIVSGYYKFLHCSACTYVICTSTYEYSYIRVRYGSGPQTMAREPLVALWWKFVAISLD